MKTKITKVTDWIAEGSMNSGFSLMEVSDKETPKAYGVICEKWNSYGNLTPAVAWFPKSKVVKIENDFYINCLKNGALLVPSWLKESKVREGFDF